MPAEVQQAIFAEYQGLQGLPGLVGHRLGGIKRGNGASRQTIEHEACNRDLPLAGFYLLDADDREQAIDIAARIPAGGAPRGNR